MKKLIVVGIISTAYLGPMIKKWRNGKYQIGSESSSHIQSIPSLYSIEK